MRYAHAALVTINRELEESAQTSGAGFWSTLTRITLPLLAPSVFSGWIYVFLGSIRQLALVSLLAGPATYVISTSMFHIWELGNLTDLAAFAVMVVIVLVAIALGFQALAARVGLRVEATTDGL
jgi:iron(III) transport system permease protein